MQIFQKDKYEYYMLALYIAIGSFFIFMSFSVLEKAYLKITTRDVIQIIDISKRKMDNLKNYSDLNNKAMSHEKYWAFFEKLDYPNYQLHIVKKDEVLKLKQQIKQTNKNDKQIATLKKMLSERKVGTHYYYTKDDKFFYVCENLDSQCKRHYF